MSATSPALEHCARGAARLAEGDVPGALAAFTRALELDPECPQAWNNRGAAHFRCGEVIRACDDFERAVALNPSYAEAANNRGIARHALADYAGALADFDRALEIRPDYAEAWSNRGTTRHALGGLDGAIADFDRALALRPDYAEALQGRALARHARRHFDAALADCEAALRLLPRDAAAPLYHLRGGIRAGQLRFADAVTDYSRAIEIDPHFCLAYLSRANARHHLRDLGCLDDYRTAFQMNPRRAAAELIKLLATDLPQEADAILETCRKHIRICPDDLAAYARRGLTFLLLGRQAEARRDFEECSRRRPESAEYLELLIATARERPGQRLLWSPPKDS
jgi:tetratricopeptide (TPR) repeat protein